MGRVSRTVDRFIVEGGHQFDRPQEKTLIISQYSEQFSTELYLKIHTQKTKTFAEVPRQN